MNEVTGGREPGRRYLREEDNGNSAGAAKRQGRRELTGLEKLLISLLIMFLTVAVVAVSIAFANRATLNDLRVEQAARQADTRAARNANCVLFERQETAAAAKLIGTYRYIAGLSKAEQRSPLTIAVIKSLVDTERDAVDSKAPAYCDAPGLGLPEPDPRACRLKLPSCTMIPERRPKIVDKLLLEQKQKK